jgi:hypothetical protein
MGDATCRAICRLASQESPRLEDKKTGSAWRAGCASSRLAIPPWKAGAGRQRQEPTNGCFTESGLAPTRATEAKDRSDERHDQVQPISDQEPIPTIGSKAKGRAYASQMPVPGERYFIKRSCQSRAKGSRQGRRRRGAGSRPNRYPTCNQAPAYIRGPGPLVGGIQSSSSSSSPNSSRSIVIDTV